MANKKAATKKAAAKKTNGGRRSASYSLAGKIPEVKGQALVILNALKKKGAATMAELAAAVGSQLKTKQEPIAVVNHYIGKLKADGVVKAKAA